MTIQRNARAFLAFVHDVCAAALAWIWLREIPHLRTMLASIVALCGVMIIVGSARTGSDVIGIALACFMALAIAAMTVMVRRHRNTSMVAAAALEAGCSTLWSEDLQHGQKLDRTLTIRNPFR